MAKATLSPTMVTALVDMYLVMTRQGVTRLTELPCGGRTAAALETRGMITRDGDGWELTRWGRLRAETAIQADEVRAKWHKWEAEAAEIRARDEFGQALAALEEAYRADPGSDYRRWQSGWFDRIAQLEGPAREAGEALKRAMAAHEAREHVRVDHAEAEETTEAEVAHVMPLGHPRVGTAERRVTVTTPVAVAARRMPRKANRPKRRGWR